MLNAENFMIHEVTSDEISEWIKSEFQGCHPDTLVERTFPKPVMDAITCDHHKSRDGLFAIHYDHFEKKWFIEHPGYVRHECEGCGATFLEAARDYLHKIDRANAAILYRSIEDAANRQLSPHLSIELTADSITLRQVTESGDHVRQISFCEIKGKSVKEVVATVNEMAGPFMNDASTKATQ